jgi:hypothetical protein
LTAAALYDGAPAEKRPALREQLAEHEARLGLWAQHCPENFRGLHALVSAEIARIEGRNDDAAPLYEASVAASREGRFTHHEAIGSEVAARFYQSRDAAKASEHMTSARALYARWGADAKVKQLDERYPELLQRS